jgi:hypothetical protein
MVEAVKALIEGKPWTLASGRLLDPAGKVALFLLGKDVLAGGELLNLIHYRLYIEMPDDMRCARILSHKLKTKDINGALKEYIENDKAVY